MKIIFLDIDGVLNGWNRWNYFWSRVWKILHLPGKIYIKIFDVFGIREKYIRRLAKIVHKTGAKVVMSSTWRFAYWKRPFAQYTDELIRLSDLLCKYYIPIIDITPRKISGSREDEIQEWLDNTEYNIESFVILDDESFDLQKFVGNQLVKTSEVVEGTMIKGHYRENTGLKPKHIRQAIKILNKE